MPTRYDFECARGQARHSPRSGAVRPHRAPLRRRVVLDAVAGQRSGDGDATSEDLRHHVSGDLLRGEACVLEDLLPGRVVDELVRHTEFVDGRVDTGLAEGLPDAG